MNIKADLTNAIATEQHEATQAVKDAAKQALIAKGHSIRSAAQLARGLQATPISQSSDMAPPTDTDEDHSLEQTFGAWLNELFTRIGGYRITEYNLTAIEFARKAASVGTSVNTLLPKVLDITIKTAAKRFEEHRDDSDYHTILVISDLLMTAASKSVYFALQQADKKAAAKVRANVEEPIGADAWAQVTTQDVTDQLEDVREAYEGGEPRDPAEDLKLYTLVDYTEQLFSMLHPFALKADHVRNGWRSDFNDTLSLAYLTQYDSVNAVSTQAESLTEAISLLQQAGDMRKERQRTQMRDSANRISTAWGQAAQTH